MLTMFRTIHGQVEQIQKPENGSWLCLSAPTDVELANVSMETGIDLADLRAPLDDEERSRVDVEDDYTMIIVDIPTVEERGGRDWYETIPLSIIITQVRHHHRRHVQDTPMLLHPFMEGTIRGFKYIHEDPVHPAGSCTATPPCTCVTCASSTAKATSSN